jgi:outer membrane immunogenic protein
MKKLVLHVAAISVLLAGSASAADLRRPAPVKAPPPVAPIVAYNWTGCYVGGGGGYGMFDQETRYVKGSFVSLQNDNGGRGWFGTVQVGCDFQIGSNFVIGAFGDYDWSGIKGDMSVPSEGWVGEEKLRSSWAAGGRIGWIPWSTTQLLVYVSGGYTQARFNQVNFSFANGEGPTDVALAKHTYKGWFIGTGYEYGLGNWFPFPGLFWKTEYRFADYRSDQVPLFDTAPASAPRSDFLDNRKFVQTIRSELVWRFNWGNWGGPVAARY